MDLENLRCFVGNFHTCQVLCQSKRFVRIEKQSLIICSEKNIYEILSFIHFFQHSFEDLEVLQLSEEMQLA